jgi:hypothetical protein
MSFCDGIKGDRIFSDINNFYPLEIEIAKRQISNQRGKHPEERPQKGTSR